jgi:hypothetical protein
MARLCREKMTNNFIGSIHAGALLPRLMTGDRLILISRLNEQSTFALHDNPETLLSGYFLL